MKKREDEKIETGIKNPTVLQMCDDGRTVYGCNQNWYRIKWRRMAGCGPVAAAMQLVYLNARDGLGLPYSCQGREKAVATMNEVWRYVTPSLGGLNTLKAYETGVMGIAGRYKLKLGCSKFAVGKDGAADVSRGLEFIERGLETDMPVAFLNLHNGGLESLETWHWVLIVALDGQTATVYDQGKQLRLDIVAWLRQTALGGGFIYPQSQP